MSQVETKTCQNPACGRPLEGRNQKRFCSQPCATTASRTRTLRSVGCPCGVTFETTEPRARYCSTACSRRFGGWSHGGVPMRDLSKVWRN